MISGTLLDSYRRHHDHIPGDDDVDLMLNSSDKKRIYVALTALEPHYGLHWTEWQCRQLPLEVFPIPACLCHWSRSVDHSWICCSSDRTTHVMESIGFISEPLLTAVSHISSAAVALRPVPDSGALQCAVCTKCWLRWYEHLSQSLQPFLWYTSSLVVHFGRLRGTQDDWQHSIKHIHLLFHFNRNYVSIFYLFRFIASYILTVANFNWHRHWGYPVWIS